MDCWIETYSGKKFDVRNPKNFEIVDIAQALSMQCRYNGHIKHFYSVAEHSVIISEYASDENKLWGLLHDAAEAYISDMPAPIKQLFPKYQDLEFDILWEIRKQYNLKESPIPDEIKDLDRRICIDENKKLMLFHNLNWEIEGEPLNCDIQCWDPDTAYYKFMVKFNELILK